MARQSRSPTILLTRPMAQSQRFAAALAAITRLPVVISPLMETRYLPATVPPGDFSAVVLTSESGARAAGGVLGRLPHRAWCVGDRTAAVAREMGFSATSANGDAEKLIARIRQGRESGPLLHLRGTNSRGNVAKTLTMGGIETEELIVYDQAERPFSPEARLLLNGDSSIVMPLFSPRTARIFARQGLARPGLWVAALSPAVAQEITGLATAGLEIADQPDAEGMLLAVQRLIAAACGA